MRILHVDMSLDPVTDCGTAERILQYSRHLSLLEMLQDDASIKEMGERFRQYVTGNYTGDIEARR